MANRKWPEKNPEDGAFSSLTTPLSVTAPGPDPRPGYEKTVNENEVAPNTIGYTGMEGGKGRKKR